MANDVVKPVAGSYVPVLKDEKLSVRILVSGMNLAHFIPWLTKSSNYDLLQSYVYLQVDHSIIESFAQGGRTTITSRVYPTQAIYGAARLFLFNNATDSGVTASLQIWQMNSAFIRPFSPDEASHASFTPVTIFIKFIVPLGIFLTLYFVR